MTLPSSLVNDLVKSELERCHSLIKPGMLEISGYDETTQIFTVSITSKIDNGEYLLEVKCDNYNEWPPFLEFFDKDGNRGSKNAYPKGPSSFFHDMPCICNPCSRKAYLEGGPHFNRWSLVGWKQSPEVNTLTNLYSIIDAISKRINNKQYYEGRMK